MQLILTLAICAVHVVVVVGMEVVAGAAVVVVVVTTVVVEVGRVVGVSVSGVPVVPGSMVK